MRGKKEEEQLRNRKKSSGAYVFSAGFQGTNHPPRGHHHPHQLLLVCQLHPSRDSHHGSA